MLQSSGIEKVYLFDIVTKIYIATDISQIEMEMYELCCDMIDVALDITSLYGLDVHWITIQILMVY